MKATIIGNLADIVAFLQQALGKYHFLSQMCALRLDLPNKNDI